MVAREVAPAELAADFNSTTIAYDGIAVIVNYANAINGLSSELIAAIFNGEIDNWLDPRFDEYR
jgi:phosphate transport system substrate-binding protein